MKKMIQSMVALVPSLMLFSGFAGPHPDGGKLKPGDLVCIDSGGGVIKVDASTGEQTLISSGDNLIQPFGVALNANGQIIVSDTGLCCTLIKIDPETGQQSVIADNSQRTLGVPFGIALDHSGDILVANAEALLRVDSTTGRTRVVSSGGRFLYPVGVALGQRGEMFVLNMAFPPEILMVNPGSGTQRVVARGGYLNGPQGIAIDGDNIYVTDVANPDRNFGIGRVIHINRQTGVQTVVSQGEYLIGPVGITVDESGQILVADPYTINPGSRDLFDGGIIRIDPMSGVQTLIARGSGSFVNPRGIAVVSASPTGQKHGKAN